jgi:hypothetical protein
VFCLLFFPNKKSRLFPQRAVLKDPVADYSYLLCTTTGARVLVLVLVRRVCNRKKGKKKECPNNDSKEEHCSTKLVNVILVLGYLFREGLL